MNKCTYLRLNSIVNGYGMIDNLVAQTMDLFVLNVSWKNI